MDNQRPYPPPALRSNTWSMTDLRGASEALQRAAEAMAAFADSFRRQLPTAAAAVDGTDPTRLLPLEYARVGDSEATARAHSTDSSRDSGRDSPSLRMPFATPAESNVSTPVDGLSLTNIRLHTAGSSSADAGDQTPSPPSPSLPPPLLAPGQSRAPTIPDLQPPPPLPDFFARRRPRDPVGRDDDTPLPLGRLLVPGDTATTRNSQQAQGQGPGPDWPITSGSTPTLAPAPVTLRQHQHQHQQSQQDQQQWAGQPFRSWAAHVDLVEAAERFKSHSHGHYHPYIPYPSQQQLGLVKSSLDGSSSGRHEALKAGADRSGQTTDSSRPSSVSSEARRRHRQQQPKGAGAGGPRKPGSTGRPAGFSGMHEVFFVLIICLAQVLMLAGIGQALSPASIIGKSFPDTTAGSKVWYTAAYGLTAGTFVLPAGRLGDLFGHNRIFVAGFLWFAAWSLVCGFAGAVQAAGGRGTVFFCFSRAMQGVGPALLVPNGQAMLGRAYGPGRRKNFVMSLFGAAAPLGFVAGAVMASLFATKASWPWAFWSMAAVCAALAALGVLVLPKTTVQESTGESLWLRMDGTGMALGVSGLVLLNFAFNQAPIVSWTTPYTYFLLVISALLLAAFVYVELAAAPHPLVPIAAMRSQTNFVLGCTGAGWACFSIWVYYSFTFLEDLRGWSPLLASAAYAPGPVSGLAASLLTGYLMGRLRPHWIMFVSMCAFFLGSILMVMAPARQPYWFNTFFSILIMPFGMDMSNPAATILLSNSVSKEHQGIAASLVVTVVNYSISIALGVAGTVESQVNAGGNDVLAGYRGAQYFGLGLGGLGIVLAATFLVRSYIKATEPPKV